MQLEQKKKKRRSTPRGPYKKKVYTRKQQIERVLKIKRISDENPRYRHIVEIYKCVDYFKGYDNLPSLFWTRAPEWIQYRVYDWVFRINKMLNLNSNIQTKEMMLLRYGDVEGNIRWDKYHSTLSYNSSRTGMVSRMGEERAKEVAYNRAANFRNPETSAKGIKAFAENRRKNPEKYTNILETQLCYWLDKGMSEEEARKTLSERQATFTLEKCIKKYGNLEGTKIWQERQDKWQQTLNNKTQEEKNEINERKNIYLIRENETKEDYHRRIKSDYPIYDIEDLIIYLCYLYDSRMIYEYNNIEYFIADIKTSFKNVVSFDELEELIDNFFEFPRDGLIKQYSRRGGYMMNTTEGYTLRSLKEIDFYFRMKDYKINFKGENNYPNSSMKYDFKVGDFYIEIMGYPDDKDYMEKMMYKNKTFGSILLEYEDFDWFFSEFVEEYLIEGKKEIYV